MVPAGTFKPHAAEHAAMLCRARHYRREMTCPRGAARWGALDRNLSSRARPSLTVVSLISAIAAPLFSTDTTGPTSLQACAGTSRGSQVIPLILPWCAVYFASRCRSWKAPGHADTTMTNQHVAWVVGRVWQCGSLPLQHVDQSICKKERRYPCIFVSG